MWRGDVLFMLAALVWSFYSVLVRRFALDAVRATIAITALAFLVYVLPVYTALLLLQWVPRPGAGGALDGCGLSDGVPRCGLGGHFRYQLHQDDPVLWPGALHHDYGAGAWPVGPGGCLVPGEPLGWNVLLGLALVTSGGIVFGVRQTTANAIKSGAIKVASSGARG